METITFKRAEQFAAEANINGVASYLRQQKELTAGDRDRDTEQWLKEKLMAAYIASAPEMDQHVFSNIRRIATL